MASPTDKPTVPTRPAVDEWGMYDPLQAGLAALFARLESGRRPALPDPDADRLRESMKRAEEIARKG